MRTRDDIEAYLSRSGHPYRELDESTWLVRDPSGLGQGSDGENIIVRMAGELVIFRVKVLELSQIDTKRREAFFADLLSFNASDMVHGAYGISGDTKTGTILLTASLRLENLDYNELIGTLDDFGVALAKHMSRISSYKA